MIGEDGRASLSGLSIDIPFGDSPFTATLAVKYLISDLKEDGGPRERSPVFKTSDLQQLTTLHNP